MNNYELTPEQIIELDILHRKTRDKRMADRIKCVLALADGWPQATITSILRIDETTARKLFKSYCQGGVEKLLQVHYKNNALKLSGTQIELLRQHLRQNIYTDSKRIVVYIKKEFNVTYTVSGTTCLLHRLGFSFKKPKHVPGKQDPLKQLEFLEELETLKSEKGENDPILYADATHPYHNSVPSYGWIETGTEKELKSNCGRQRLNINGAIDSETLKPVVGFYETVNAQTTIKLLKKIEKSYPDADMIHIIVDNARYYRSRLVKEYLEGSRISFLFLPAYSPNLNLIERYWKFFHKIVVNNRYYERFIDFEKSSLEFFRSWKKYSSQLKSLLAPNFHISCAS